MSFAKNFKAVLALSLATVGLAHAAEGPALFQQRWEDPYDRVITITPQTKSVNVNQGESVKFVDTATGLSFVWRVDTNNFEVDLAKVAPVGIGRNVKAYVQPNNAVGN